DKQQFVVIEHTTSDGVHWDLMLDRGEVLWTWRLDTTPGKIAEKAVSAERISDHPRRFLAYEGPVQNNTGQV
ncbi:MAG: DNA polymerase ligase N-terminal domain-containing protein, partial [Planctomycetota bacterium]